MYRIAAPVVLTCRGADRRDQTTNGQDPDRHRGEDFLARRPR